MGRDWAEIRRDFLGTDKFVFKNAAAASLMSKPVVDAVSKYMQELQIGGDLYWDEWLRRAEAIRFDVARFVGAEPEEIAFVTNTSEGMNILADLTAADGNVLANELEFPTVTLPFVHRGATVHFIPAIEGELRLEMLEEKNAPRASTIAISHVQFSNGFRTDLEALAAIKGGRRVVVSGSQSIGVFPIDVKKMKLDGLGCAGHKWLGAGFGAGFVYVSQDLLKRPPRTLGWRSVQNPFAFQNRQGTPVPEAKRYELGCPNFAGIFALGAAIDYIRDIGLPRITARVLELNEALTNGVSELGYHILSPLGAARSGETLVAAEKPEDLTVFLRKRTILVTEKPQGIRISTHYYNNMDDIGAVLEALKDYRDRAKSG